MVGTYVRCPVRVRAGAGLPALGRGGPEYLDFLAGISVGNAGHCHPLVARAVPEQAKQLVHVSNLFYTEPACAWRSAWPPPRWAASVFFCNSGAEANEAAIKLARSARPRRRDRRRARRLPRAHLRRALRHARRRPSRRPSRRWSRLRRGGARSRRPRRGGLRAHRRGPPGAGPGRVRGPSPARRAAARGARGVRPRRRGARLRRGPVRHGPHRHAVGVPAHRGRARRHDRRQGASATACPWAR